MDYYRLYMKYKNKYLKTKSYMLKGGAYDIFKLIDVENPNVLLDIKIIIIKNNDKTYYKLSKDNNSIFVYINELEKNDIEIYDKINKEKIVDEILKNNIIKLMKKYFDSFKTKP